MKLLGITSADSGIIDELLIKFVISSRFWRRNESIMARYITYLWISSKPTFQLEGKYYSII
jgi:hypothetical protein